MDKMRKTVSTQARKRELRLNAVNHSDRVHEPVRLSRTRRWVLCSAAAIAVFAAYANHFHNSFHFDDSHTIENNVYIRDLRNLPLFFSDARTFSSLPANQTWRPLVSASLALDYRIAHGLVPFWFHVSTFFWFFVQLVLMVILYSRLLNIAAPGPANWYVALFAVSWYGLHPANAETINYIIQRGDLYSTLGVVAGLVIYVYLPKLRTWGLYLLPVALGALSKAPAVVFGGILLAYIFLFEENADRRRWWPAVRKAIPALAVCTVLAILTIKMTSKSYVASTMAPSLYWATQPFVISRFFRSLFLPLWLSADSDLSPVTGFLDPQALLSLIFCITLMGMGVWAARRREYRPISFGIFWFFFALAPTSLFVLSEVENDHRMFFPFVGLILSATWTAFLTVSRLIAQQPVRWKGIILIVKILSPCILLAYGFGTRTRNEVWHTEASLWRDVTLKSPENGRGLMNYGLTLMSKGDIQGADDYFKRAADFTPNYYVLEINRGIVSGLLNRNEETEAHFRRAIELAPQDAQPYFFYGRWLKSQGRVADSIEAEKSSIERNPAYLDPRYTLMQAYLEQAQGPALKDLAQGTLNLWPEDNVARDYLARTQNLQGEVSAAENVARAQPSAEHFLSLSLLYFQHGNYQDCITASHKALGLKPDYAEAYNNIAAAYEALHQWDRAIDAAEQAVRLKPDFMLAKNNLAYSRAQKAVARSNK